MHQQQYLNQFYLANEYLNPFYYQMPQLMNQNPNNPNIMINFSIPPMNPEMNLNINNGGGQSMMNPQQFQQGADLINILIICLCYKTKEIIIILRMKIII